MGCEERETRNRQHEAIIDAARKAALHAAANYLVECIREVERRETENGTRFWMKSSLARARAAFDALAGEGGRGILE